MHKLYLHPLPVRIWHWINALGFLLLIATGLQIRYLDLFNVLSFRSAVVAHNWIGFALIANYFLWLGYYLSTDKISVYIQEMSPKKFFEDAFRQLKFYGYGIFVGDPNPHHPTPYKKFNALQSMLYQIVMVILVPILFGTGLLLWNVEFFAPIVNLLGGVRIVDTLHVLMFIVFSGFIVVHVYLASLGPTTMTHFKAMVTGYEEMDHE